MATRRGPTGQMRLLPPAACISPAPGFAASDNRAAEVDLNRLSGYAEPAATRSAHEVWHLRTKTGWDFGETRTHSSIAFPCGSSWDIPAHGSSPSVALTQYGFHVRFISRKLY